MNKELGNECEICGDTTLNYVYCDACEALKYLDDMPVKLEDAKEQDGQKDS